MADEGSADRTVTSKTIANLLNQARNCNALNMADEELFQQHLNEFFDEPDEENEEELGDPSTIYAAPDRSSLCLLSQNLQEVLHSLKRKMKSLKPQLPRFDFKFKEARKSYSWKFSHMNRFTKIR
ncbi:hypothetical protein RRG08_042810 [Elysia crispata]|uniref:Uncharacterized protein n=1 Tax=Elysia crispata TaxID=231223 RepID=A0AAE0YCC5_9GAST|nr:hypothetical protein RRG08_042810 [Elysia crispata]